MTLYGIIICIIIGVMVSVCYTFASITGDLRESNDMGDSKSAFHLFTDRPLRMIEKKDDAKKSDW